MMAERSDGVKHMCPSHVSVAWRSIVTLIFICVLCNLTLHRSIVLSELQSTSDGQCDAADCQQRYEQHIESLGLTDDLIRPIARSGRSSPTATNVSATSTLCQVLGQLSTCLDRLQDKCRGGLNYHSRILNLKRSLTLANCTDKLMTATGVHSELHEQLHGSPQFIDCALDDVPTEYRYCSVFGAGHLQTTRDECQTCRLHGAWTLIDTDFFSVQISGDKIVKDSGGLATRGATFIKEVTIKVKYLENCGLYSELTYHADSSSLPETFEDGVTTAAGNDFTADIVMVRQVTPFVHVEIDLHHIYSLIVLRRIAGRYLSVSIRVPADVATYSGEDVEHQLCVVGCPGSQLHQRHSYRPRHSQSSVKRRRHDKANRHLQRQQHDDAMQTCRHRHEYLADFYLDSCAYDLIVTGDLNATVSAYHAQDDEEVMYPDGLMCDSRVQPHATITDVHRYDTASYAVPTNSCDTIVFKELSSNVLSLLMIGTLALLGTA